MIERVRPDALPAATPRCFRSSLMSAAVYQGPACRAISVSCLDTSTQKRRKRVTDEVFDRADQRDEKKGDDGPDRMREKGAHEVREGRLRSKRDGKQQKVCADPAAGGLGDRPDDAADAGQERGDQEPTGEI